MGVKITLSKPLKVEGVEVSELDAKAPNFGNIIAIQKPRLERVGNESLWRPPSEAEQALVTICETCGITEREAKEMCIADVTTAMEALAPFLA